VDRVCLTLVVPHELAQFKRDQSSRVVLQVAEQVAPQATKTMISVAPRLKAVKQFVNY
jgi:ABC-type histidine transport system ATPase subunit